MKLNDCSMDLSRELQDNGYVFIPHWHSIRSTRELADITGTIVDFESLLPGSGIPSVQTLQPRKEHELPKNRYSCVFGLNEFPLHTDLAHWAIPPRYLMLRCINGSNDVTTRLLPASAVIGAIGHAILTRALFKPRRSSRHGNVGLLPLLFSSNYTNGLRWDSLFLTPMNAAARDVLDFMTGNVGNFNELREITLILPGDTLIIDNWRMLHGRSKAVAEPKRVIERAYLSDIKSCP